MSAIKTRFRGSEHTKLRIKFVIHDTREGLNKVGNGDVWGFCSVYDPEDVRKTVAIIHMARENFLVPVLAHEVFHAATAVVKNSHLTGDSEYVDEIFADTIEHVLDECLKFAVANDVPILLTEP